MATFNVTPSGAVEDFVRLDLAGQTCAIVKQYEVKQSFFTQPCAFAITIGSGETAHALASRFPARTPYELYIGDVLQQTGRTDGYTVSDGSGATTLQIRGRDQLAPLLDSDAEGDESFSGMSWTQITTTLMAAAGIDDFTLFGDNTANRSAQAGVNAGGSASAAALRTAANIAEMKRIKAKQDAELIAAKGTAGPTLAIVTPGKPTQLVREGITVVDAFKPEKVTAPSAQPAKEKPLKIKAGENRFSWLRDKLGHAGLFLFSAAGADMFVLAQPNVDQRPVARLLRQRGGTPDGNTSTQGNQAAASALAVNVLNVRHKNETTGRHRRYVVHGRGGRGAAGRSSLRGEYEDAEMVALGFPKSHVKVEAEREVKSDKQAEYEARRLCAAARREGWEYIATVQGHTAPALQKLGERVVWTVDTIIEVIDDELGFRANLWLSDVTYRRGADGTTTELVLHRAEDLVFADAEYL